MSEVPKAYVEIASLKERDLRDLFDRCSGVVHIERLGSGAFTLQIPRADSVHDFRSRVGDCAARIELDSFLLSVADLYRYASGHDRLTFGIDLQDVAGHVIDSGLYDDAAGSPVDIAR